MARRYETRRFLSVILAAAMIVPVVGGTVEAAVVTWLSPQPDRPVRGRFVEVSVGFNTQSDVEVTRVDLLVDGQLYLRRGFIDPQPRGVASFTWDTSRFTKGPHKLAVRLFSGDDLLSTVSSTGMIGDGAFCDMKGPTVRFSNIKSGDVIKGTKVIQIKASDDSGEPPLVSLFVDKALKLVKNTAPYNYDLDTTTYTDGAHQLETYAYDAAGNKGETSIVKVEFRNNQKRPLVTEVNIKPSVVAPAPADEIVKALPPVTVSPAASVRKTDSAARSESTSAKTAGKVAVTAGRVRATVKIDKPQTPIAHRADSGTIALPLRSAISRSANATIDSVAGVSEMRAAEPAVEREIRATATATALAPTTSLSGRAAAPPAPIEKLIAPETSQIEVPATPRILCRPARPYSAVGWAKGAARPVLGERIAMGPVGMSANLFVAKPKPIRAAMSADNGRNPGASKLCRPPQPLRSTQARLEKKAIPGSGKTKLRDLIHALGGIVFWDAGSRTVTAFVGDMKIEMKIGSDRALVNGREMKIDQAPYISNGRTVVDASIYVQAKAVAGQVAVSSVR